VRRIVVIAVVVAFSAGGTAQDAGSGPPAVRDLAVQVAPTNDWVEVVNVGTERLRRIELVVRMKDQPGTFGGVSDDADCTSNAERLRCTASALGPREQILVRLDPRPRVITEGPHGFQPHLVVFSADAAEAESDERNNRVERSLDLRYCSVFEPGGGELRGTSYSDRICGRSGHDRIHGADGGDWLEGGDGHDGVNGGGGQDVLFGDEGHDRLVGDAGRDRVFAGPGHDVVRARDGARDRISCGRGHDRVVADPADRVARDCERVSRRSVRA
jgi:hypothetical protein